MANVEAAVCSMDCEVTSQGIPSDSADMASEVEPGLSRGGNEVSITEEVHPFHVSIYKETILEEIVSNIGPTDWQWHEDRTRCSSRSNLARLQQGARDACLYV